jgi:O-antigen ligase
VTAVLRPAAVLDALVGSRGAFAADLLIVVASICYVALFLAVRRATNACFLLLLLLALWHLVRHRGAFARAWRTEGSGLMLAALASVFVAAVAAKLLRGEFNHVDLDGPVRFLLAGLVLLYFMVKRTLFVRMFAVGASLAPIAAIALAPLGPEAAERWVGRFATSFVDPNILGSYAVILSFMILLTINGPGLRSPWLRGLGFAGIFAGLVLAVLAGSRGGWLAIVPLAALWVAFRWTQRRGELAWQGLGVMAVLGVAAIAMPEIAGRGLEGIGNVRSWADGSNPETPAGIRLSIWALCLELIAARPLLGYGWSALVPLLTHPDFVTSASPRIVNDLAYGGPHNDLLSLALGHGVFGIAAYAALLFVPMAFFWRRSRTATGDVRLACELGVCFTVGVLICGLTNEMLSLKYLCSFYGLTVAGLAAQVLGEDPAHANTA